MTMAVRDANLKVLGYDSLDDVSTAKGLANGVGAAIPANARYALVQAIDNDVNWRDDGTAPQTGNQGGFRLVANDSFLYTGDLKKIKFIESVSGSTADVNVVFYS